MRLINADEKGLLMKLFTYKKYTGIDEAPIETAIDVIHQAPTIDAVPVVRCKDCKHRYGDECPMRHVEWVECEEDGFIEMDDIVYDNTDDDGYCSYGELEDGEA